MSVLASLTPSPTFRKKMSGDPHMQLGNSRSTAAAVGSSAPPPTLLKLTEYGGDPTGHKDSADAFDAVLAEAWKHASASASSPHNMYGATISCVVWRHSLYICIFVKKSLEGRLRQSLRPLQEQQPRAYSPNILPHGPPHL